MPECPLCFNKDSFTEIKGPDERTYQKCPTCHLIFTEDRFRLSKKTEKARYETHNNGIHNEGYVKFLNQAIEPALPLLNQSMQGLDYGCGPMPTLSVILEQKGFACNDYDPFFFPDLAVKTYDYIFATESFEHFSYPAKEIQRIKHLLKSGGLLVVMTETWKTPEAFAKWYYAKDFTHVCFFHDLTFEFIAKDFGFELLESRNNRVKLLRKK